MRRPPSASRGHRGRLHGVSVSLRWPPPRQPHVRRGGEIRFSPWLAALSGFYVLLALAWVRVPFWGIDTSLGLPAVLTGFDKTFLSLPRLLHVLALAYLIVTIPALSNLARTRIDHPLAILSRALTDAYHDFARKRSDDLFETRVPLAQARFLFRVAKSKTRLIDSDLKRNKSAVATAREILRHCTAAADYLDRVLAGTGSGANGAAPVAVPEEGR